MPRTVSIVISDCLAARLDAHCAKLDVPLGEVIVDALDLHLDEFEGRYFVPTSLGAITDWQDPPA